MNFKSNTVYNHYLPCFAGESPAESCPMMKTNKRRLRIKLSLRSLASSYFGQIRISRPSAIYLF